MMFDNVFSPQRTVPLSATELAASLKKLFENERYIMPGNGIRVTVDAIEIDLNYTANKFGGQDGEDMTIPIARGMQMQVESVIQRLRASKGKPDASAFQSLATELYGLLDHSRCSADRSACARDR